jgi:hypothetical protein
LALSPAVYRIPDAVLDERSELSSDHRQETSHSWPAFIPITFEMTILFGGISAVLGMLALNGLPMPYHPVFNVPRFAMATKDRFFLIVFSTDPKFSPAGTRQFLEGLGPRSISEVPS